MKYIMFQTLLFQEVKNLRIMLIKKTATKASINNFF